MSSDVTSGRMKASESMTPLAWRSWPFFITLRELMQPVISRERAPFGTCRATCRRTLPPASMKLRLRLDHGLSGAAR